jgi:hypothetical protein
MAESRVRTFEPRDQPPRPRDPTRFLHLLLYQLHAFVARPGSSGGRIFANRFLMANLSNHNLDKVVKLIETLNGDYVFQEKIKNLRKTVFL